MQDNQDEEFKRFQRQQPSPSLMSVSSIPMIRITDTEMVVPIASSRQSVATLQAPIEDDGVRVILNKRISDQRSTGFSSSDKSDDHRNQAPAKLNVTGEKSKQVPWKIWRRRLYTVLWVHLLMRYRAKFVTLLEIFLPVLVMLIFVSSLTSNFTWTVGKRAKDEMDKRTGNGVPYNPINERALRKLFCDQSSCNKSDIFIVYTPSDKFTRDLMRRTAVKLALRPGAIKPVRSEGELIQFCKSRFESKSENKVDPVGVVFTHKYEKDGRIFPQNLAYQIRTFTPEISNTAEIFPYIETPAEDHLVSPYVFSGFVGLQNSIDKAYVDIIYEWQKENCSCSPVIPGLKQEWLSLIRPQDIDYSLQMFPFTLFLDLKVRFYTWSSIMLAIILGYFCTTFFMVKQIIIDLDSGVLELLKLHGLVPYIHWLSLLFHDFLLRGFSCIFMTWIMFANVSANGGLLKYDNPVLVWLFFLLHGVAKSASGFFLAVFFTKPTFGGAVAFMLSFLSFFIPINLYISGHLTSKVLNAIICLFFPNWCLANGLYHFLKFESFDAGLSWSDAAVWADEKYILLPMALCSGIFFLSIVMFMTLTIYIDRVSNKYLSPKESYLFFLKCKKTPKEIPATDTTGYEEGGDDFQKPDIYEGEDLPCKVKCRNLTQYFGDYQLALDNVSLNFYEDQITVVLGHSGSGKTTLLHILAGLIDPAIGTARVVGVNPVTNKQVRLYIGFCPQKLILFQDLSVEEHVRLACMLHSNSYKLAKELSGRLLVRFNLWEVKRVGVRNLNEGQKRKLAIAMALSTNPPVLILDEPTFGMDPAERHEIWNCLRFLRSSRTIIVTTSTMDEADTYADKIVLLARGKVLCYGSPGFLKKMYNSGSYLKITKQNEEDVDFAARIVKYLYDTIDEGIHEVHQKGFENQDRDIYLALPIDKHHKFSKILAALEEKKFELGIRKISMTHATLGGIFFRLSNEVHFEHGSVTRLQQRHSTTSQKLDFPIVVPSLPKGIKKDPNWLLAMTALFTKQLLYIRQKHLTFLMEYLTPLVLCFVFVRFSETYIADQPGPTIRPLTANTYPRPPIPIRLQVVPAEAIEYWKEAFNGTVGSTRARIDFGYARLEDTKAFMKKLMPVEASIIDYQAQVVIAFVRDSRSYVGLYASNALHSAPIAQNMLTNAMLYLMSPKETQSPTNYTPYRISTSNRPLQIFSTLPTGTIRDATNALAGVVFGFLLSLIAASKMTFCIIERTSGVKSLQLATGVHFLTYWSVIYACDFVVNLILSILLLGIFCLADTSNVFYGTDTKVAIFIIIILYLCWGCLPFGYFISRFMANQHNGYGQFICFHILTGSLPEIAAYLLLRNEVESNNFFNILRYAFLIFPSYSITAAFVHLCDQVSNRNFCQRMPSDSQKMCTFYENKMSGIADSLLKPIMNHSREILAMQENDIYFHQCCQGYCKPLGTCFKPVPYFVWEGGILDVALTSITLAAQGIIYWSILLLMESEVLVYVWAKLKSQVSGDLDSAKQRRDVENETIEMHEERERINAIIEFDEPSADALLVADVTKYFGKKKALEHIYFSAQRGTIVGILGPQVSGKTVLLRILSGDLPFIRGSVYINNLSLHKDRKKFHEALAYCPQINPILDYLTGFQMMELVARLRGIPYSYVGIQIKKWLELLGFEEQEWEKKCINYPPGMRRRLSCAMTLIGDCRVLMFDEPTAALDPLEHLQFWNLLTMLQKRKQTIIFTSNRAEECIQVTTKLVMLGSSRVLEIGTPEEIYERYANGWTLVIRYRHDISQLDDDRVSDLIDSLHEYILSVFSPCQLREDQDNLILYHVFDSVKSLSYMYEHMESAKEQLPELIDDYYITEANLDDVIGNLPTYSNLYHKGSNIGVNSQNSPINIPGGV